jgi:hypothetical protein
VKHTLNWAMQLNCIFGVLGFDGYLPLIFGEIDLKLVDLQVVLLVILILVVI